MGVVRLKSYFVLQTSIVGKIERDPLFQDRSDMQDRKWLLFTCLFSLPIFEDSKTRKFCFWNKTTTRLSRHSFEK